MKLVLVGERGALARAVHAALIDEAATARNLADRLTRTRSEIHAILVRLRARGMVECAGIHHDPRAGTEYVWRATEHARFHTPDTILPGVPRCRFCRRRAWEVAP
jgi:transcription initiation factor IIE alpha subunit